MGAEDVPGAVCMETFGQMASMLWVTGVERAVFFRAATSCITENAGDAAVDACIQELLDSDGQ